MRTESITSAQNPKIKNLLALQEKSKERRKKGLFVVEGRRELLHCIEAGYEPYTLFICRDIISQQDLNEVIDTIENLNPEKECQIVEIPQHLYDKVAYRGGTEGVIAELYCKNHDLDDLKLNDNPLVVILESVEKPGNLGAVLRSADAAGADAVIICDPLTDLYNPNLIRSSLGGIFTNQVVACSNEEALEWLRANGINIFTAQLQDSQWYYDTNMVQPTAIVMGTESVGLTDFWRVASNAKIKIPMLGELDSLNVSVSAAVLCYEAVRQRNL